MIDIENIVFNTVATALQSDNTLPTVNISSEYIDAPAAFPAVTLTMDSNTTYVPSQDSSLTEHHASVMFSVNVYSNKKSGKKAECKKIADAIDNIMRNLKFTRSFYSPIPNVDRTIYRITARYTAVVAAGETSGANTIYQIFRR